MKKTMKRISILTFLLILGFCLPALAANTADAKETIDPTKKASLSMSYVDEGGIPCSGLEIALYRVSSVTKDYTYPLVPGFSPSGIDLSSYETQEGWKTARTTLNSFITAKNLPADQKKKTGSAGEVSFTGLEPGFYFVKWTKNETEKAIAGFEPTLLLLPDLTKDGTWNYEITAKPKPGKVTVNKYRVTKVWNGGSASRRTPVEVKIYKNGALYQNVTLSEDNTWTYTWEDTDKNAEFTVAEDPVPKSYKVSVTQSADGATFTITNKYSGGGGGGGGGGTTPTTAPTTAPPTEPETTPAAVPDPPAGPTSGDGGSTYRYASTYTPQEVFANKILGVSDKFRNNLVLAAQNYRNNMVLGAGASRVFTGDNFNLSLYIILLAVSGVVCAGIGVIGFRGRKGKKDVEDN